VLNVSELNLNNPDSIRILVIKEGKTDTIRIEKVNSESTLTKRYPYPQGINEPFEFILISYRKDSVELAYSWLIDSKKSEDEKNRKNITSSFKPKPILPETTTAKPHFTVTIVTLGDGKVFPDSSTKHIVPQNESFTLEFKPDSGNQVKTYLIDNVPGISGQKTLPLVNITKNHSIVVIFEKIPDVIKPPKFEVNLPAEIIGLLGKPIELAVKTSGSIDSIVWRKNGGSLPGKTGTKLVFEALTANDSGTYEAVLYGSGISVNSTPAKLNIVSTGVEVSLEVIGNGLVHPSSGNKMYVKSGEPLSLKFSPLEGSQFMEYELNDKKVASDSLYISALQSNITVKARFVKIKLPFKVGVSSLESGTLLQGQLLDSVSWGDTITLEVKPNVGYSFGGWTKTGGTGEVAFANLTSTITKAVVTKGAVEVSAQMVQNTYTVSISSSDNAKGTVSLSPIKTNYHYGDTLTLSSKPATGYLFRNWEINGTSTTQNTVVITENTTIKGSFESVAANICTNLNTGTPLGAKIKEVSALAAGGTLCPAPGTYSDRVGIKGIVKYKVFKN